jgi:hypothetical protein
MSLRRSEQSAFIKSKTLREVLAIGGKTGDLLRAALANAKVVGLGGPSLNAVYKLARSKLSNRLADLVDQAVHRGLTESPSVRRHTNHQEAQAVEEQIIALQCITWILSTFASHPKATIQLVEHALESKTPGYSEEEQIIMIAIAGGTRATRGMSLKELEKIIETAKVRLTDFDNRVKLPGAQTRVNLLLEKPMQV